MARTILVEASPWNATTGATVPVALAGGGVKAYRHRSRNDWLSGIVSEPRFSAKVEFDQNGFSGGARPQLGPLEFFPASQATIASLSALLWAGAAIEVFVGDDELAVPTWTTLVKGTVVDVTVRNGQMSFALRDASAALDDPALTERFAGTGDIEGDSTVAERVKRRSFGRVFNVEARLLNAAELIFEIGDPSKPLQSIDDVKDMGRSASSLVSVAWQGSVTATLNALIATTAPQGGGVIAPSIACVKWWTTPQGPLTVDFKGEIGSGYVETAASIAERIVSAASSLTISNVAAINGVRGDVAGIHLDNASESSAQALDRLLKGVSILWQARADGVIELSEIKLTSPVETVRIVDYNRERTFKPVKNRRLGYQRNHRQHSDAEIAQIEGFLSWLQASAPSWDETEAGQRWIDTDDGNREYQRTLGPITIGSARPTIGGNPIFITWRAISDIRIEQSVISAAQALTQATQALAELDNIASDNVLSAGEKPDVVQKYNAILGEQSGIEAQATSYAITTEKTAYTTAVSALTTYLSGLSPAYNNYAADTAVVRVTFNSKFTDVYNARQTLLNKIAEIAGTRATWSTVSGTGRPEDNADVTMLVSGSTALEVKVDFAGEPKSGELSKTLYFKLIRGASTDVTGSATWSRTLISGDASSTIGSATGALTITDISVNSVIEISASYLGTTRTARLTISVLPDPPPAPDPGGGTVDYTSTITNPNSSSYGSANTRVLKCKAGPGGVVDLTFPASFDRANGSNGSTHAYGKWQWRTIGGSFADVASEIISSTASTEFGYPSEPESSPGSIAVTMQKTGLTNGTEYEFQLLLRRAGGSVTMYFYGTATAQGS
jgi:hypothetical protein